MKSTVKDSAVLYGLLMGASTIAMAASGLQDQTSNILQMDINWFRLAQGSVATVNVALTTALSSIGRYQTYRDLADAQRGFNLEDVIARSEQPKDRFSRAFNWCLKNTFNINASVSLPLCGLMIASGVTSERWGEALTGAFLLPVYLWQLKKEQYGANKNDDGPSTGLKRVFDVMVGRALPPPLDRIARLAGNSSTTLPALVTAWRNVPMAVNAAVKGDFLQAASFGLSLLGLSYKANTIKDGIGRMGGSIISEDTPNGLAIARSLLEGRIKAELSLK